MSKHIVLDVGVLNSKCPVYEYDGKYVCNQSQALNCEKIPESIIVVGSHYIGLEISQHFRRLGANVTLVDRAVLLGSKCDKDISLELQKLYFK